MHAAWCWYAGIKTSWCALYWVYVHAVWYGSSAYAAYSVRVHRLCELKTSDQMSLQVIWYYSNNWSKVVSALLNTSTRKSLLSSFCCIHVVSRSKPLGHYMTVATYVYLHVCLKGVNPYYVNLQLDAMLQTFVLLSIFVYLHYKSNIGETITEIWSIIHQL